MITIEDKDKILAYLISLNMRDLHVNYKEIEQKMGIDTQRAEMIISQMERRQLLSMGQYQIKLNAEIYDFHNHGGFRAEEEILKANFEKLHGELLLLSHKVDSSLQMRISTVLEIMSSISNFLRIS